MNQELQIGGHSGFDLGLSQSKMDDGRMAGGLPCQQASGTPNLTPPSSPELHSDLSKPATVLQEIAAEDGRKQISDALFRKILPFELRKASKRLEETCRCKIRGSVDCE